MYLDDLLKLLIHLYRGAIAIGLSEYMTGKNKSWETFGEFSNFKHLAMCLHLRSGETSPASNATITSTLV